MYYLEHDAVAQDYFARGMVFCNDTALDVNLQVHIYICMSICCEPLQLPTASCMLTCARVYISIFIYT